MALSVELRWTSQGQCDHGPKPPNAPRSECEHWIECDFGRFDHEPLFTVETDTGRTTVDQVAPLILVSKSIVDLRVDHEPIPGDGITIYTEDDRRFLRIIADNGSWTWELFESHWRDLSVCNVYVGRWPD